MAHLMYRTLRKSGLRWALVRPAATERVPPAPAEVSEPAWRKPVTPSTWIALGLASLSLLVLALVVPRGLGVGFTVTGLAALAAFRVAAMTGRWLPRRLTRQRGTASWQNTSNLIDYSRLLTHDRSRSRRRRLRACVTVWMKRRRTAFRPAIHRVGPR